ncbi:site-specific DNA-methyltransferase [Lactobacillus delbrueckii]|uniref:site-specific DNA-methyltransferase n=1 Tax=Lactobacillus delbrueckii TaxID=1584 RepID=UPI002363E277|nr:site-specific DNA-methyltransferase [Lactobacillus delbrueckii]MDD1332451.1 site-specific DNA-methyltransferase [Lactobacillus delbrueckii subsp. lactis]
MSVEPKVFDHVKKILASFNGKYMTGDVLKRTAIIEDLDKYDDQLMEALLSDQLIHDTYTKKIAGVEVFEVNQFVSMLEFKDYWEDSYTKYSNKIGLTAGGKFIDENEDVVLDFPYKDCVLKAGMTKEDAKDNDEPFLNEVIAKPEIDELLEPKVFVNAKRYDADGEHEADSFTDTDNLIIKGNNLIALYSLKKRYAGKVKLIYLDVPYNTGSDSFKYNDRFNQSTWLTFVKNRLDIANDLLTDDGVIFVHLDDNEVKYLGVIMDEIFGPSNFAELITVVNNPRGRDYGGIANMHEFIYVYQKSEKTVLNPIVDTEKKFPFSDKFGGFEIRELRNRNTAFHIGNRPNLCYPVYVDLNSEDENGFYKVSLTKDANYTFEVMPKKSQGIQTVWRWGKDKFELNREKNVVAKRMKDGYFSIQEKYRKNTKMARSVWWDKEVNGERGTIHLREMFGNKVFAFPKPEGTLKRVIEIGSNEGDLVLDFFMGSATTQAVAMKMHRRFIGIEQMDYINTVSVPRLQKVIEGEQGGISKDVDWQGGGSFVYAELMEKNGGYVKDVMSAKKMSELFDVFERMKDTTDFDFRVDLEKFQQELHGFSDVDEARKELLRILDKNQLYYNYANIDDSNVRDLVDDADYKFNKSFYED